MEYLPAISTDEPDFFHQPYLHESSPEIEDLTPLEIVLDKEAWMDEIPEDEMSGRWDEIMRSGQIWQPQLQLKNRRGGQYGKVKMVRWWVSMMP